MALPTLLTVDLGNAAPVWNGRLRFRRRGNQATHTSSVRFWRKEAMRGSAHSIFVAPHIILLHVRLFISRSSGTMAAMISRLPRVAVQGMRASLMGWPSRRQSRWTRLLPCFPGSAGTPLNDLGTRYAVPNIDFLFFTCRSLLASAAERRCMPMRPG